MGFWYQYADLGPFAPCTRRRGSPPKFDTGERPDNSINWSAARRRINLTLRRLLHVQVDGRLDDLGELSWDTPTKLLRVKGTIFFDGSIYHFRRPCRPDTRARPRSSHRDVRCEEHDNVRQRIRATTGACD